MKYLFTIALAINMLYLQAQGPPDTTYTLVFTDEFEGSHIDKKKWDLKFPWNQSAKDSTCICDCGSANPVKEQKAYRIWQNDTHNIKVAGGTVKLFVRKEDFLGEFWDWQKDETGKNKLIVTKHIATTTTAMLHARQVSNKGYYEIRFKLPKAIGPFKSYAPFGANFWLYSSNCWNEIDFFEIINGQTRNYTSNVHYELPPTMVEADTVCDPLTFASPRHRSDFVELGTIADDEWHIAAFDWQENQIIYYLDGQEYFRATQEWVSNLAPMNMIIDINAPLSICRSLNSLFVKYPYVYEVDYVKVWERKSGN